MIQKTVPFQLLSIPLRHKTNVRFLFLVLFFGMTLIGIGDVQSISANEGKGIIPPPSSTTITLNPVDETVTLSDAGGGRITLDSTATGSQTFDAPVDSLTINALDGNDTIILLSLPSSFSGILLINGGSGNDLLTADFTGGDPVPAGGILFEGGGQTGFPGDGLEIIGSFTNQTLEYANVNDGTVTLDTNTIVYTGLEPITAGSAANTILILPDNKDHKATLRNSANPGQIEFISDSETFEDTIIPNPSNSLILNLGDQICILGVTTLDPGYAASLIISGGGGDDDVQIDDINLSNTPGRGLEIHQVESLTITNSTFNNNTAERGGGMYLDCDAVTINACTISGNISTGVSSVDGGGGIYIEEGDVTISNDTLISGNSSTRWGGGVASVAGSVTFDSVILENNTAGTQGGGFYHRADALIEFIGGVIQNCTAGHEGGGVWNSSTGMMTLNGTMLLNNAALAGSAGDAQGGGGVFNNGGTIYITNATISGNRVIGDLDSTDGGGGIFNDTRNTDGGTITISNTTVENNEVIHTGAGLAGRGGGILNIADFSNRGDVEVTGGSITGNMAPRSGGGVENRVLNTDAMGLSESHVTLNNVTVSGNITVINGGGIHLGGGGGVLSATVDGGSVSNNTAGNEGGGLWNSSSGTLNIRNGVLVSNNQSPNGGGIFNDGSAGDIFISDSMISDNTATSNRGGGISSEGGMVTLTNSILRRNFSDRSGGGLAVIAGSASLTDVIVESNTAAEEGGGLWNGSTGTMTLVGGTITGNTARAELTIDSQGGGGVFNNGGTVNISNADIAGNQVVGDLDLTDGGGGIFNDGRNTNGATIILTNTTLSNNQVTHTGSGILGAGGGILNIADFSNSAMLDIQDSTIEMNSAPRSGGGIEIRTVDSDLAGLSDSSAVLDGARVIGNNAGINGGGIHVRGTDGIRNLNVIGGRISNNTAGNEGGGLWNDAGGTLTVRAGAVIDNNSAPNGGGIFNDGAGGVIEISGGASILNNTATASHGGGIASEGGQVTLAGSTVSGNQAALRGGGLWNSSGAMTIEGTTINGNTASGVAANDGGGGIFNNGGVVNVTGLTTRITNNIADGTSGSGGGILNSSGGTITITDSTISGNSANRAGGGIEDISGAGLGIILTDVSLDNNDAGILGTANPGNGGGLHVTGAGDVSIVSGSVSGNTAAREGGGLWNGSGTMTIDGVTINGNTASGDFPDDGGGGIFNNGGTLMVTGMSEIANNNADGTLGSGGGIFSNSGGTLTVDGQSVIDNNSANRAGGGIEIAGGTAMFQQTFIRDNDVDGNAGPPNPGNGGGLHVTGSGMISFTNCIVADNVAANEGGGLWNSSGSTMTLSDSQVVANIANSDAPNDGGGGIFNNGGTVNITSAGGFSSINNNGAPGDSGSGGGILSLGGILTVSQTTLENNSATRGGGAIEISNGTGTVTNNNFTVGTNTPSELAVDATISDDTVTIDATSVSFGANAITYDNTVQLLTVLGLEGNDIFEVTPSADTALSIQGDSPSLGEAGVPPGDALNLNLTGISQVGYSPGANPGDGTLAFGTSAKPIGFISIETTSAPGVFDFGDAPDSYQTLAASNGARHSLSLVGPILGMAIDYEADGLPGVDGTGDDLVGDVDDEDGVLIPSQLVSDVTNTIEVFSAGGGEVELFLDLNANGTFDEPEESFGFTHPGGGAFAFPLVLSTSPTPGDSYARFRISSAGGQGPKGSASDGEVEDYAIEIIEAASPTIDCPSNLSDSNDPGACSASIAFTDPIVTGAPIPTVACFIDGVTITSPHNFEVGVTTVFCVATNVLGSATCSFTVTVEDTEPPSASCQSVLVALDELGAATITAASIDGGSTDNCAIASLVLSSTVLTCAEVGINEVTLTVTDPSGNDAICNTTVEVVDLIAPSVVAPTLDGIIADMNGNAILPDLTTGVVAMDNCSSGVDLSLSQSPSVGTSVGVGETVITFSATDTSGNVGEATVTLTVHDSSVTPTPSPTSGGGETPTPTTDYDIKPDPVDGVVNALDLLEWYSRVQDGSPTEILFDFSRFWQSSSR